MAVEFRVGLPAVDKPRLNLEFVRREPLNANAIEKPRSIGRDVGRLVGPIVKIVVAEKSDVRNEYAGVNVEAMIHVEVIPAVGFGKISVRVVEFPLADTGASVVPRGSGGKHAKHSEDAAAHIAHVKVASETQLLELHFAVAKALGRAAHAVVAGLVVVLDVVGVDAKFGREIF